jgi:hypothetical protein
MQVASVIARLKARTTISRVEGATQLQALIAAGALPAAGTFAFVVPMGLRGGQVQMATGAFVQATEEVVAVVLALRDVLPEADRARDALDDLIEVTMGAIAGWQAPGAIDVFRLSRGSIVSLTKGLLLYQLEFAVSAQLRILS